MILIFRCLSFVHVYLHLLLTGVGFILGVDKKSFDQEYVSFSVHKLNPVSFAHLKCFCMQNLTLTDMIKNVCHFLDWLVLT